MKQGDLIRYRQHPWLPHNIAVNNAIYIVRWTEAENNWVCVYGVEPPLQMSMMETVSEAR